jgi:hypothetical protein
MRYLVKHTASFIVDRIPSGFQVWKQLSRDMMVVFIRPEEWSINEEDFLQATFRDVGPEYARCEIRSMPEAEACALGYIFSNEKSAFVSVW